MDLSYNVRYAFDLDKKNFVAFQILAENASFAYYNRVCYLNICVKFITKMYYIIIKSKNF